MEPAGGAGEILSSVLRKSRSPYDPAVPRNSNFNTPARFVGESKRN
jgi:hypothetical protein